MFNNGSADMDCKKHNMQSNGHLSLSKSTNESAKDDLERKIVYKNTANHS